MDFATLSGIFLGISIILTALLIGHVPLGTIIQPEAVLIVLGGTLTSVLIQFSFDEIQAAVKAMSRAFYQPLDEPEGIIEDIIDAVTYVRMNGLLAIEPLLNQIRHPFLYQSLTMLVDNQPTEHIEAQLATQMEIHYKADLKQAQIFEAAGGFAPTMGIIGAIVGLVQVMGMFHSPSQLGHGVGNAFIATLYGVGSANLFLLPLAGKLKQRAKDEWFIESLILQGVLSIRSGEHPILVREKLAAYLTGDSLGSVQEETLPDYLPQPVGAAY